MIAGKTIIAVIPARGGSKRLFRKNLIQLGGIPLIAWSIRAAKRSGVFLDILVSTDDQEIAEAAVTHGARVSWMRPAELASDTASVVEVMLYDLDRYQATACAPIDAVMLLQPTSPYRRPSTIRRAVEIFLDSKGASVVGVSPAKSHPLWCLVADREGNMKPYLNEGGLTLRSQDLPPAYEVNGSVYLTDAKFLRNSRSIYTTPFRPVVIEDPVESIDIDTPFDWKVAEAFLEIIREGGNDERLTEGELQANQEHRR